jgi:hypothetical protein
MRATEQKTQRRVGSCEAGQSIFTRWRLPESLVGKAKCMLHKDLGADSYLADQLLPLPLISGEVRHKDESL